MLQRFRKEKCFRSECRLGKFLDERAGAPLPGRLTENRASQLSGDQQEGVPVGSNAQGKFAVKLIGLESGTRIAPRRIPLAGVDGCLNICRGHGFAFSPQVRGKLER